MNQACGEDELRGYLGLQHTTGKVMEILNIFAMIDFSFKGRPVSSDIRPIEVFMCSVKMRQGVLMFLKKRMWMNTVSGVRK